MIFKLLNMYIYEFISLLGHIGGLRTVEGLKVGLVQIYLDVFLPGAGH